MSLKTTGIAGDGLTNIISSVSEVATKKDSISKLIKDIDNIGDLSKVLSLGNVSEDMARAALEGHALADSADDVVAAMANVSQSTKGIDGLVMAFKGLGASLVSMGPFLIAGAALAGLAYGMYKYEHAFEDQLEKSSEAAQVYQESKAEVESLNSELETMQSRIAELQAMDSLTLTEESELASLEAQTAELERQIALKDQIAESDRQQDEKEAIKTLEMERTKDLTTEETYYSMSAGDAKQKYEETDIITATKNEIKELKKLDKDRKDLLEKRSEWGADEDAIDAQIDLLDAQIDKYKSAINENLEIMNELKPSLPDTSDMFKNITSVTEDYINYGLSEVEQAFSKIESHFSGTDVGTSYLSDQLKQMAADGTLTADAVKRMGVAIDGVDAADIARYFNDMAKSAQEAADAANNIDGSFEGVATAMESENAGSNYEKLNDYLKTAKDLYDKDLTGTDDFKSVAELLSYGKSNGNADQFIDDYNRIKKYITEDDDGNLTKSGIGQFLNDLSEAGKRVGKDWATLNDETGEWAFNLDNTAEAAKELGISVESMEAILGRIQDYDNIGNFEFKSAIEDFSEATTALEGLKSLYDEMDEGKAKKELGLKIEGWENEYAQWENDLSTLDQDAIVHIILDYDLAQIRADIQELDSIIRESGSSTSTETYASRNAANTKYINKAETAFGLDKLDAQTIPVDYKVNEESLEKLRDQLLNDNLTDDEIKEIQIEIGNIQDVQMSLLDAFSDSEYSVGLNADSSVDEISQKFNDFINTTEAQNIILGIEADTSQLEDFETRLSDLPDAKEIKITTEAQGVGQLQLLRDNIELVNDKDVTVDAKVELEENIDQVIANLQSAPAEIKASLNIDGLSDEEIRSKVSTGEIKVPVTPSLNPLQQNALDPISAAVNYTKGSQEDPDEKDSVVDYLKGTQENPTSPMSSIVNYDLGTQAKPNPVTVKVNYDTSGAPKFNGTAHAHGSLYGHAFASGNTGRQWGLPNDERALINEVGEEVIVRQGKAMSINNGYPTFANLKKGDIIFNHKQSEELLKNGYITGSHAKVYGGMGAFANGTLTSNAYAGGASGSFSFTSGSSKSYSSSTTKKSTTSATKAANNAAKATKSAADSAKSTADAMKDLLDKLNKYVDEVKIRIDRVNRDTQKAIDAIDTAVGLANKQASTATAISKTQTEMAVQRQGYDRYMAEAASVASKTGLSSDIQAKIRDGSISITEYDDNTQEKIKLYQKWYEAALDCLDAIDDLKKQEQELALQRLDNIQDYYDAVNAVYDATKSANDAKIDLDTALGSAVDSKVIKDAINNSISQQQSTYNKTLQQLVDYQSEFNDLVNKGYIQRDSDAWYEGQKVIQEFTAQVDESATALIELQDQLRAIDYTKLQQTIDRISSSLDRLQNGESLKEKRDERVTEAEYLKQISTENASIDANYQLRSKKLQEQALYAVGSERYNEIAEEIAKIDDEIYSSLENIEDLKDAIFEVRFADFNYDRQAMQYLLDDLSVLQDLLNSDAFVDSKTGALTSEGLANIAIIGQQMAIAKQEIAEYTAGIKKLDGMLQSGLISTVEYEEKQREFIEAIQDSALAVEDYKESLINLYIEQLNAENDALQKSITLRKKALKATKDYYDYADSVNSQTKDLNALKAVAASLAGVTNASAQAELKRINAEIAEQEKSLAKTKADHEYTVISNGYDELSDSLNESLESTLYELTYNASKQEEVVSSMLNSIVGMYSEAYGTIQDIILSTGIVGSTDFNNSVSNIGSSSGAADIVADATQSQSTITSGDTTNGIATGNVGADTSTIEDVISREPNTDNRPVAEITLSKTSVSIEEGKSTSVTASVRPTDAKNRAIVWTSSNTSVATVSNGTIKAVRRGSATITASAADGSGVSVSCGVTVTPTTTYVAPSTNTSTSTQGDGKVQVGDKVTFTSGRYYYDSYGTRPAGSKYQGKTVTITKINTKGSKPYHISTGSKLGSGDLGWLTQSQIKGYHTGTKSAKDELAFIDDTADGKADPGSEVIMTKYGALRQMNQGDKVFSKAQTEKLWELSKNAISNNNLIPQTGFTGYSVQSQDDHSVNLHFDAPLITIENASQDIVSQIKGKIPEITNMIAIYAKKEARKS